MILFIVTFLVVVVAAWATSTKLVHGIWFSLMFSEEELEERRARQRIAWLQAPLKGLRIEKLSTSELQKEYPLLLEHKFPYTAAQLLSEFLYSTAVTTEQLEAELDYGLPCVKRHTYEKKQAAEPREVILERMKLPF